MIVDPGVNGKVTCRMIQVPWDQALDVILKQHGLTMVVERSISHAKKLKE
jgi:type II secretory pathway component HofQ